MQLKRFKPDGYTSLSPYLMVTGAQRVIDFLKQTLDAKELRRFDMPDGTIAHVELRIDDTVVMLAEGGGTWPPSPRGFMSTFPTWMRPTTELSRPEESPFRRRSRNQAIPIAGEG